MYKILFSNKYPLALVYFNDVPPFGGGAFYYYEFIRLFFKLDVFSKFNIKHFMTPVII